MKRSLKIGGLLATYGIVYENAIGAKSNKSFHVALLSDTHVKAYQNEQYRGFFPARNLEKIVKQILEIKPDSLIINGDIARLDGGLGDYTAVKSYLDPLYNQMAIFMTLGNHDHRENFYEIFSDTNDEKQEIHNKHVLVLERHDMEFILLDSLMYVNKTPGLLGKEQRNWLKHYLANSGSKPTFVFVHHTLKDGDTDLLDADKMFDILIPHDKVKAIFYGHSHIYKITDKGNLKLINLPAVGYNFIDSQPVGWIDAKITPKSGVFTLHAIGGNMEKDNDTIEVVWT